MNEERWKCVIICTVLEISKKKNRIKFENSEIKSFVSAKPKGELVINIEKVEEFK